MATLADLQHRIGVVRAKEWRVVFVTGLCRVVAALIGVVVVYFLLDWVFDLPYIARLLALVAGLSALGYVIHRYLVRELRRVEDDEEIALRVEGRNPDLRGRLISTLQLSRAHDAGTYFCSEELLVALEDETLRMAEPLDFSQILNTRTLKRLAIATAVILAVKLALVYEFPSYFAALGARIVNPRAQFPTRTHIENIGRPRFVARGEKLQVCVLLAADSRFPDKGVANFINAKKESTSALLGPVTGDVSKKLEAFVKESNVSWDSERGVAELASNTSRVFWGELEKAWDDVDLVVSLGDARSEPMHIRVLARPEIDTAASGDDAVRCILPAYTHEPPILQRFGPLSALVGSTADFRLVTTKPLKSARMECADGRGFDLTRAGEGPKTWHLTGFPFDRRTSYHITLLDTDGLASARPPVEYAIETRPDLPPIVKLTRPAKDVTVTPTARPTIIFTARDDYGLRVVWLVYRVQAEGQNEGTGDVKRLEISTEKRKDLINANFTWDLASLEVKIGDQVVFWLEADDECTTNDSPPVRKKVEGETEPAKPTEPEKAYARSQDVKLTVISRQDKAAELEADVERLIQQIEHAEQNQEELKAKLRDLLEQLQKLKAGP
jgi:hypothetical protein